MVKNYMKFYLVVKKCFLLRRKNYFYIEPDLRDLNYSKYFEDGSKNKFEFDEYNSQNTKRLNIEEMKFLLQIKFFISK